VLPTRWPGFTYHELQALSEAQSSEFLSGFAHVSIKEGASGSQAEFLAKPYPSAPAGDRTIGRKQPVATAMQIIVSSFGS
jgi:hypothetical protein